MHEQVYIYVSEQNVKILEWKAITSALALSNCKTNIYINLKYENFLIISDRFFPDF